MISGLNGDFNIAILHKFLLNVDEVWDAHWWNFILFCEEGHLGFEMLLSCRLHVTGPLGHPWGFRSRSVGVSADSEKVEKWSKTEAWGSLLSLEWIRRWPGSPCWPGWEQTEDLPHGRGVGKVWFLFLFGVVSLLRVLLVSADSCSLSKETVFGRLVPKLITFNETCNGFLMTKCSQI